MAPMTRKRRSVPRSIGEANPPGTFSKAKCVFVSLAGSEYHHANRVQLAAATTMSNQSMRSEVDTASRRTDQLDVGYCRLRTCAILNHHVLAPSRTLSCVETGRTLQPDCLLAATRRSLGGPDLPGRLATVAGSAPAAPVQQLLAVAPVSGDCKLRRFQPGPHCANTPAWIALPVALSHSASALCLHTPRQSRAHPRRERLRRSITR